VNDDDRLRWARALTTAGWLLVFAYLALVVTQLRRAVATTRSSFPDGVWGSRLETVSFVAQPFNTLLLAAAAGAGAVATVAVGARVDRRHVWLEQLVRVVAGLAYVVAAIAALRVIVLFAGGPDAVDDFGAILNQLGGILVCAATVRLCLEAERTP
jgi:hypothetical protein